MNDMAPTIIPKSDQKNADDLLSGPITIKITNVTIRPGTEQPISVFYEGDDGKPWKPCKSMARVLVTIWGPDSKKYIGRSVTLYCDPKVKWGGMEVGGIRVSHMSDIESAVTMALTVTRANKKPYTVKPIASGATRSIPSPALADAQPSSPALHATGGADGTPQKSAAAPESRLTDQDATAASLPASAADHIPEDAALIVDIDKWLSRKKFKSAADIASFITDAALKAVTLERIRAEYERAQT